MRSALVLAASLGILIGSMVAVPVVATASYVDTSVDAQQPTGEADIDVNVDGGGAAWWTSPFWIAIGVVALLLIIAIIAMAARGGGTTVIKD